MSATRHSAHPVADPVPPRAADRWRPHVPTLVAWVVRIVALTTLAGQLSPGRHDYYSSTAVDSFADGASYAALVTAAGVELVLARALRRRKRRAWRVMVVAVAIGTAAHMWAASPGPVIANGALLLLLLWSRRDFTARSEAGSRWRSVRVLAVMLVVSLGAGLALTEDATSGETWWSRITQVAFGLVGFAPNLAFRHPVQSSLTQTALVLLGGLTALLTLLTFLAPARKPAVLVTEDESRLRGLLDVYGCRDSLGYFALRRDKSVVFAPSGKAAVAHRVVGAVSLASGDPVGEPAAWPDAVAAWLAEVDAFAWTPGVLGASERGAAAYAKAGLDALEFGDEAVLDLSRFSLDGRALRPVRQAVNRVRRAGYTLHVDRQRDVPADELAALVRRAAELRDGAVERGFSMALGRLGDPSDPELVLARAVDAGGRVQALLTMVPWGPDGLSLDVMRRDDASENGTVEFVVVGLAECAAELGVSRLSLNFAVFRSVFERGSRLGAGPVLRLWRAVLLQASRWWQIESLYRANAKYHPDWVPRFVCFRRPSDLPRVGLAALEAEAFVVRPRLTRPWR